MESACHIGSMIAEINHPPHAAPVRRIAGGADDGPWLLRGIQPLQQGDGAPETTCQPSCARVSLSLVVGLWVWGRLRDGPVAVDSLASQG